ncbi:hypothetical protein HN51_066625 [Arachis hypogaea]|nr:uncharacterized protein DS421_14g467980 [Arachis hypogaea]
MSPDDGYFPGLYYFSMLRNPWLSDGYTMIIQSIWHSNQVLISVNVLSPVDIPQLKYGTVVEKEKETGNSEWSWLDVSNPIFKCSDKTLVQMQDVASAINALQFYANVQPTIRGRNVYVQFSSHQELTSMDQNQGRGDDVGILEFSCLS